MKKELGEVQKQIDNIVTAIAGGMFHSSMKEKMDELEKKKYELECSIIKDETKKDSNNLSKEVIINF